MPHLSLSARPWEESLFARPTIEAIGLTAGPALALSGRLLGFWEMEGFRNQDSMLWSHFRVLGTTIWVTRACENFSLW